MKTYLILMLILVITASCKRTSDLTDIKRTVKLAKVQQKIDSAEFANHMWVLTKPSGQRSNSH